MIAPIINGLIIFATAMLNSDCRMSTYFLGEPRQGDPLRWGLALFRITKVKGHLH